MTTNQKEMFGSLLLDKKIVTALTDMGFEEPSPIQEQTIPLVLDGYDVIGQAKPFRWCWMATTLSARRRPVPVKLLLSVFRWFRALPTISIFRRLL